MTGNQPVSYYLDKKSEPKSLAGTTVVDQKGVYACMVPDYLYPHIRYVEYSTCRVRMKRGGPLWVKRIVTIGSTLSRVPEALATMVAKSIIRI